MIFKPSPLAGAYLLDLKKIEDDRGFFARSYCKNEFDEVGLNSRIAQCNVSYNRNKGTLRGMHFQAEPFPEAKVVRCTRGAIWDVIIDLRIGSPTYLKWHGVELNSESHLAFYVPEGFAHGFQTLVDDSEVLYMMSEFYQQEAARGVRWDDPAFAIEWPVPNPSMSQRDRDYPLLQV
jgi:dTDP-4-dehydrorhamnose 3,5-epimerase